MKSKHMDAVDGLRGFAVILVLIFHSFVADFTASQHAGVRALLKHAAQMGWAGVDLFFVLSGFLITGILLRSRTAKNYYAAFYARRSLRILPVNLLSLALIFFVLLPFEHIHVSRGEELWYWFSLSNLRSAFYPLAVPFVSILWTLSIEEQFYLVWPAVVHSATPRRVLWISAIGLVISPILRNLNYFQHLNTLYPNFIYRSTFLHIDGLFCGAGLAVIYTWRPSSVTLAKVARWVLLASAVIIVALSRRPNPLHPWMTRVGYSVVVAMWGSLLWLCVSPAGSVFIRKLFEARFLRQVGIYSYSIYIWQVVVRELVQQGAEKWFGVLAFAQNHRSAFLVLCRLASLLILYGLASASWVCFEQKILRFKDHFRYEFPTAQSDGRANARSHSAQAVPSERLKAETLAGPLSLPEPFT